MKFKTVLEKGTRVIERDGIAVEVEEDQERKVPVLPRDWSAVAVRAAVTLVMTLTVASVAWSTYSIGTLLGGGVGFIAAAVFDLGWAVCLILEWLARYLPAKRVLPRRLGWALLVATMGAIWWHGWAADSIPLATVGAAVSAFAKVLWLGVMKHIDRELTPDDAAWVAARISEANAKAAVADATRNATRMEQRATLERLAMQREQAEMREAFGLDMAPATLAMADAPAVPVVDVADAPEAAEVAPVSEVPALPAGITPEALAEALRMLNSAVATPAPTAVVHDDVAELVDDAEDQEDDLPPLEPPSLATLAKSDAIRIAVSRRPGYTPSELADLLATYDVHVTADYVRQVQARDRQAAGSTGADVVPINRKA